jgi:hypothetical protein
MPFVTLMYYCFSRYVNREGHREYISLQKLEHEAKGTYSFRQRTLVYQSLTLCWHKLIEVWKGGNPRLSFSSSVCASADGSWGGGTLGYHSLALCEHQLMELGRRDPWLSFSSYV